MSSVEKIMEGMRLMKEGCSEIHAGDDRCSKSTCPFGWICYGEEIDAPEDWDFSTPDDCDEDESCEEIGVSNLGGYDKVADQLTELWF